MNFRNAKVAAVALWFVTVMAHAQETTIGGEFAGFYDVARAHEIKPLTFPRIMLYDAKGILLDLKDWPVELADLKREAGDYFCCISDDPADSRSEGPPKNCTKIRYGENVEEHFRGLKRPNGESFTYQSLPKHKFLLVDYYAAWCAPCLKSRAIVDQFVKAHARDGYTAVIVDFSNLH